MKKYFNEIKKFKKGSVTTVEFVIVLGILTIFLFLPFALYSSYQTKAIVEDTKERALQLVSIYGEVNTQVLKTLATEFTYYGLVPPEGKRTVIIFSNISEEPDTDYDTGYTGNKTVVEVYYSGGTCRAEVVKNSMPKAYKKNKDVIFCEMQVPANNFLNSILKLINTEMHNTNMTGATLAYKSIGYRASEYVE